MAQEIGHTQTQSAIKVIFIKGLCKKAGSGKATEEMNLRLDKYGNDVEMVDSLDGAKSAARVRRKKRDMPRRNSSSKYTGVRESMDEEAIAELYAGQRYANHSGHARAR